MDRDLERRLALAKRRHAAHADSAGLLAAITERTGLGPHVQLCEIEESTALAEQAYARLSKLRDLRVLRVTEGLDQRTFLNVARQALANVADRTLPVLLANWTHVGALLLRGTEIANNLLALVELDGDTVTVVSREGDYLASFDMTVEGQQRSFEVVLWTSDSG